jgi:protein tyrosine phosphatase (PTP) superfamily phosphohydrolase (DUF442 family)
MSKHRRVSRTRRSFCNEWIALSDQWRRRPAGCLNVDEVHGARTKPSSVDARPTDSPFASETNAGRCAVSSAIRLKTTVLVVSALLLVPAVGRAGLDDVASAPVRDLSSIHIDNFGEINPAYYRGAEPDDDQYAALAAVGVKTIIDLRSDDADAGDKLVVENAGMRYVGIPMTTRVPPTPAMVQAFLELVTNRANQPVYVHCVGGKHRTGVMTAIYRMTQDQWTADRAFKEMKQYKFGADFLHPEFKKFVYEFRADSVFAANPGQ